MVCRNKVTVMLSYTQKKDILNYFKNAGFEVTEIAENIIDVEKKAPKYYLQLLIDDDITVSRFSVRNEEFHFEFDNYYNMLKMSAKFSVDQEIELQYAHPFLGMDIDMEKYKLMPVSHIVIGLLSRAPVSSELLRDIYHLTKDLDELIKEGDS